MSTYVIRFEFLKDFGMEEMGGGENGISLCDTDQYSDV